MKKLKIKSVKQPSERPPAKPGKWLNGYWKIGAIHSLFSETGKWYHLLISFPGALSDRKGFIKFKTRNDFLNCSHLNIDAEINVPDGISEIPGYTVGDPAANWDVKLS